MAVDCDELKRVLTEIRIDPAVVAVDGHADYCWCLERAPDGQWEVYWSERGNKNGLVRLPTESDACLLLLGRLAYSQLLAGSLAAT